MIGEFILIPLLFYRHILLKHSFDGFHQRFPFFFRDAGSADVLLHQLGKRAVVILGQYFRQLLLDWFLILVLVHDLDVSILQLLSRTGSVESAGALGCEVHADKASIKIKYVMFFINDVLCHILVPKSFISIVHGNKANGVSTSIIYSTTALSPNVREIPSPWHR